MNVAHEIVTHVLRNPGDITKFLGLNPKHPVLFAKDDEQAWNYIRDHYQKHGVVPSDAIFRESFPKEVYPLADDYKSYQEHQASELAEIANERILGYDLTDMLSSAITEHDKGNFHGAVKIVTSFKPPITSEPFRHLDVCDLDQLPDPVSLIDGIVELGSVARLTGYTGTGKSFLALDWACCVATGQSWLGHRVRDGKVLYVAAEGASGLKKRVGAWQHRNKKLDRDTLTIIRDPVQFGDSSALNNLIGYVREGKYEFVIIDTQARSTVGLEENSAKDTNLFVDGLYKLRDAVEEAATTVLVVHHTGYEKTRARGSSAGLAGIDAEFLSEATDPHELMTLSCLKQKDGEPFGSLTLKLEKVVFGPGRDSLVVVETDAPVNTSSVKDSTLALVMSNPGISTTEVAKAEGIQSAGALKRLKALEKANQIRHEAPEAGNLPATWFPVEVYF